MTTTEASTPPLAMRTNNNFFQEATGSHFPFMRLPSELRNRIYRILLCSWDYKEPAEAEMLCPPRKLNKATGSIDTTILRTSKQVYREAYDVMVKTNQFVYIRSTGVLSEWPLLTWRLPIVTGTRKGRRFRGYVLSVILNNKNEKKRFNELVLDFMILGCHWPIFCRMLGQASSVIDDFELSSIRVIITLKTVDDTDAPEFEVSVAEFFTPEKQRELLKPLTQYWHNSNAHPYLIAESSNVHIIGSKLRGLAASVIKKVNSAKWSNHKTMIQDLQTAQMLGREAFSEGKLDLAYGYWKSVGSDIQKIFFHEDFCSLDEEGGLEFRNRLHELFFTSYLNALDCLMTKLPSLPYPKSHVRRRYYVEKLKSIAGSIDENQSFIFDESLPNDWGSETADYGRLQYIHALSYRLMDIANLRELAISIIQDAVELCPNDQVILKERREISAWKAKWDALQPQFHPIEDDLDTKHLDRQSRGIGGFAGLGEDYGSDEAEWEDSDWEDVDDT